MFKKLNMLLTKHDKLFLGLLVVFSIFISFIETLAISVIMPFVSLANDFDLIHENKYFKFVYDFLNMNSVIDFITFAGVLLFFFYIFRSVINMIYFYMLAKFSEGRYFFISQRLFKTYLNLGNQKFNNLNTAHLTKMIVNEASYVTQVISSILFMISEIFVIIFIYALLLYVDWKSTLLLSFVLLLVVSAILIKITKLVKTKGREREKHQRNVYDILSSSFGNFKVIKLFSNEKEILDSFSSASRKFVHTNILFETTSHIPRLILDGIGFASLSFVVTFLVWKYNTNISEFMPILALYILALYRLLPSIHRIIVRYNKIMFYASSIELVHKEINYNGEELGSDKIVFENSIRLKDIDFVYEDDLKILNSINLEIYKGEHIGIIGESGSGKSTFVDILIGLSLPSNGAIFIDSDRLSKDNLVSWRKQIGYVPQSVYLFDGSVGDNIVFGRIHDSDKLVEVLKQVKLWDFFSKKNGIDTKVGEGGKLLSGGQKQRVAIARALYSSPEIIVLDEATSALDSKIEEKIMRELYVLCKDKTLIIISHNETILERCNKIIKVENKGIVVTEKKDDLL